MANTIFISYRRDDSAAEAGALCRAIRDEMGEKFVFMDTSTIEPGVKWPSAIENALNKSSIIVVVIGPDWVRSADEWGQRRLDQKTDWVRQEIALALKDKRIVIPILVRGAKVPPRDVLPESLKDLFQRQKIELRRDYWDHDIKMVLAQFHNKSDNNLNDNLELYPSKPPVGPDPISNDKLKTILESDLTQWKKVVSPLPEDPSQVREEIYREYKFQTFQEAIHFMCQVAPGCDIAMHHPRWENLWKTIRVYLTTWDIGHRVSDRDVQLARYFDRSYSEYPGSAYKQLKNIESESFNKLEELNTLLSKLTNETRTLLKEASLDSHGTIIHAKYISGTDIQTNGKNLISSKERREISKWEAALQDLVNKELIVDRNNKGEIFEVSNIGYQLADMIELNL